MPNPINSQIASLIAGNNGDPFAVLGMHEPEPGRLEVRTFFPGARSVELLDEDGTALTPLPQTHPEGFFAGEVTERSSRFAYRLRVDFGSGPVEMDDPYRFPPVLGEMDVYFLAEGTHLETYLKLGAHPMSLHGVAGTCFAVWAPNARRVSVVGDFNQWDGRRHPMRLHHGCGVWEIFLPAVAPGDRYKFEIKSRDGDLLPLKSDPYAMQCERPPQTASVVRGLGSYEWGDEAWMTGRGQVPAWERPISVYEVHLGSWRRRAAEGNRYLSYRELADELISYVQDMGFTHIELLPVSEYPFDGSWGYQPTALYAPTSRFGEPDDFRHFVDRCHQAGIGVLVDWVAAHFPEDAHGLSRFDGTYLYEHADPRRGRHVDWGTLIYNYGRREVANFLLSNALFWLRHFHIDGLRVDAVASMLYLDYSRRPGEWIPNPYGGNENIEAVTFLKRMNEIVYARAEGAITVAEESTAWPMVSRPTSSGGLGFGFKWNMGWMHDTLRYFSVDSLFRRYHQGELTFGLIYAFHENFMLPLSHDEVVHGKRSILGRMPGDRWQRFANVRLCYAMMYTYPGKKLLFMGNEFAQEREWDHDTALDWHLLDDPLHSGVRALVRDLNRLYREHPALHQRDCDPAGFRWIDFADADRSIVSYLRLGHEGDPLVVVCNFTPVPHHHYRIGVPGGGWYHELLNSDSELYGGSNMGNFGGVGAEDVPTHGMSHSISISLPPLAVVVLRRAEPA